MLIEEEVRDVRADPEPPVVDSAIRLQPRRYQAGSGGHSIPVWNLRIRNPMKFPAEEQAAHNHQRDRGYQFCHRAARDRTLGVGVFILSSVPSPAKQPLVYPEERQRNVDALQDAIPIQLGRIEEKNVENASDKKAGDEERPNLL